ncbi:hypothetical protein PINS_up012767 [Pythium insidiosum]|nr:hypothetical protein PINS_up012767 [Pythium insidiosum]
MEQRLAALRRDQEIDGLRVYLIKYNLFPRNRDPHNSPIRVEELKELVKHWKLHRQRGFWRDHPDKDDLVRALLQHIRSEAANKKRRQEAQEKYARGHSKAQQQQQQARTGTLIGSGEMSEAARRGFSKILNGGRDDDELMGDSATGNDHGGDNNGGDGGGGSGPDGAPHRSSKSLLKRRMGGDLFYQRGDYDEGMIYLSRIDKSRFLSEAEDPRHALRTTVAAAATPLGHLVQMGNSSNNQSGSGASGSKAGSNGGVAGSSDDSRQQLREVSVPAPLGASASEPALLSAAAVPSTPNSAAQLQHALLSREMKLRCVEGLYNVSCHRGFEMQTLREGALATLNALLKTDDTLLRLYATATLANLTAGGVSVAVAAQQHAQAMAIARASGNGTTAAAGAAASSAKAAMMAAPPAMTREIHARLIEDGVLSALLELTHTPHTTVKALCARALFRLTSDESHHFRMVHEGVVVALLQLMTTPLSSLQSVRLLVLRLGASTIVRASDRVFSIVSFFGGLHLVALRILRADDGRRHAPGVRLRAREPGVDPSRRDVRRDSRDAHVARAASRRID